MAKKAKKKTKKKAAKKAVSRVGQDTLTIIDNVDSALDPLGIAASPEPDIRPDQLDVPPDITSIHAQHLGQLYSYYTQWCRYLHGVVGRAEARRIASEHAYTQARARALADREYLGTGRSVAERKAHAEAHPDTVEALRLLSEAEASLKQIREILEGDLLQCRSLSREITRRQGLDNAERREGNLDLDGDGRPNPKGNSRESNVRKRKRR